jgi:hypothetical protein
MQLSFEIDGSLPKPARRAVRPQSPVLSASPLIHEKNGRLDRRPLKAILRKASDEHARLP